jgi:N-(2-amino-2-carboxyethyl)-L-glutamate synthase
MIYSDVSQIVHDEVFLDLDGFAPGRKVFLKIEGLNPAGSIKLKTAVSLIASVQEGGSWGPGTGLIESSSGNLGIALATVCAPRGIPLTIVSDPNASQMALAEIRALGARVVVVRERDRNGGYLGSRIDYVRRAVELDPGLVWLNQYANEANTQVHRERTAASIHRQFPRLDGLFVGAGTTGTLMGCVQYFTDKSPGTVVTGVDSVGSVTFGGQAGRRRIPGLGTSRRPELYEEDLPFQRMLVEEYEAVQMCRRVAHRYGLLIGGSTGTVLSALARRADEYPPGSTLVAVGPDLGDKYLETVYSDEWVETSGVLDAAYETAQL